MNRRLRWLVLSHLPLAAVSVAIGLVPPDIRFLPLLWALCSISPGQLMLLSFWGGMGAGRAKRRFAGILLACVYLAVWPALGSLLAQRKARMPSGPNGLTEFGSMVALNWVVVSVLMGAWLLLRRWFSELRFDPDADKSPAPARVQYSILTVLVITAVIALLLGLMRGARPTDSDWRRVAILVLGVVTLVIDNFCAVWAALGTGRIGWRVFIVLLVASVLGAVGAFAGRLDTLAWWLAASMALVSLIPSGVVILSLLVVRSCGYRLGPKAPI